MWDGMRKSGAAASPDVQALDQGNIDASLLSTGRTPLGFGFSNEYVAYKGLTKAALMLAPYPRVGANGAGGLYIKPTFFFTLSAQSKNPDAAAELLNFLLTDVRATAILGVERGVPASPRVRESLKGKLDESSTIGLDYLSGLGALAGPLPPPTPPGGGEVISALLKMTEAVAFGTMSSADGAKSFVDDAAEILARAKG